MPSDGSQESILHLDLDAFFAAVEQRDKPSLRGRPVVVGGIGPRGVVSTASYEARAYGARSAMPTAEARRRCPPGTAFLAGRHQAYRITSQVVMSILREASPLVEQVSVDEAYVDLAAAGLDLDVVGLGRWARGLLDRIAEETGGLTASVGIAGSKMLAKIGSELDKPAGVTVIPPGTELDVLHPMPVRAVAGVGPATAARLHSFGVETVGQLARVSRTDLVAIFGQAHGASLYRLARAEDDRPVLAERETKSLSAEETFPQDVTDRRALEAGLETLTRRLAARLAASSVFARTITVKVRLHDFTTLSRSGTLPHATGEAAVILREARALLSSVDTSSGVRLLGLGVSGLTDHAQDELGLAGVAGVPPRGPAEPLPDAVGAGRAEDEPPAHATTGLSVPLSAWQTGQDVVHGRHGRGWVWGAGRGGVSIRFEGPTTGPGPVRTYAADDPQLHPADPPDWRPVPGSERAGAAC